MYRAAACGSTSNGAAIRLEDTGTSGYQYDAVSLTWQFNWKTTELTAGCYYFTVTHTPALLTHGPFGILLR